MNIDDIVNKIANFIRNTESKNHKKNSHKSGGTNNKLFNIVVLILIGILLVIGNNYFKSTTATVSTTFKNKNTADENMISSNELNIRSIQSYEEKLTNKLKNILEKIDGVGKVDVMIYFESGEEKIPAININDSNSITDESDNNGGKRKINQSNNGRTIVMLNKGQETEPFITKTYEPKITGICIVAEGAKNKITELRIRQAVVNLFNLSEKKVNVYPMKN
ncbi:hypothetical protein CLTEP_00840 [Clostridium tepidiprofundi DSM 19306]|uniref:Stage III sporulation protein AG n=1 Tax=Clostridium tepidiprofundi DSM 19306 TaxID=1121338 RepID=A0A151B6X6_9CLOT|nr:stage III sporulation protein AG [Clostridium tepidiprofundi]KYH35691.1 hypothetical protein CLTEP_00840 [Clostridium tepidiprofundi DSM 19306]